MQLPVTIFQGRRRFAWRPLVLEDGRPAWLRFVYQLDNSLSGRRVARELDRIAELRGRPAMIVSDNGTELTSHANLGWQHERNVAWLSIGTGTGPWIGVRPSGWTA